MKCKLHFTEWIGRCTQRWRVSEVAARLVEMRSEFGIFLCVGEYYKVNDKTLLASPQSHGIT